MRERERRLIFDRWMREHRGLLLKIVRAYAFTSHDQEDLFQEIALQLWNSVPRHKGEAAETTWIYRVALYSAVGWVRREGKHRGGRTDLAEATPVLTAARDGDDRVEWLFARIAELNEVDRSVMLLLLDGFGYREIAAVLGISESNVGVKISRIKRRFAAAAVEETTA